MTRPTLKQACAQYVNRYTLEHVPAWALKPHTHTTGEYAGQTLYYAPQYRSDAEWYANTVFPGEPSHPDYPRRVRYCHTTGKTWPLGQWLQQPFRK